MNRIHAAESATNVIVGYLINLLLVHVLLSLMGYEVKLHENAEIGLVIAIVAFLRGYTIRYVFHRCFKPERKAIP